MARRRGSTALPDAPVPTSLGTVELRSDSDGVMLLLDGVESSHLDLDDAVHLVFEYMQQMQAVLRATHPGAERLRALHLGGAGCAFARAVDAEWPQARQIAVEIDALLATYVRDWFDLPRSPRLRIRVGDARHELVTFVDGTLDVVVRDAFSGRHVPEHMRTQEFTTEVARRLRPGGLYLANLADSPPLRGARREAATVRSVFSHVVAIGEPGVLKGRRYGNIVLAASDQPVHRAGLTRALRSLPVPAGIIGEAEIEDFVAGASVLTDPPE
ncbi:spermidine synthase [Pseudactinotalea sp.]|uniref:spermidine synthase n=1 Tax=Pseudactinotalea sp. TaxID=1926260 RepID=UPI003B3B31EC